ncbi:MAG: restriction endonuclease subunit S [Deltaproteobacteria bacterium]|nr:restriction endonuclease subunit S [Deltaproteobacteria bacterium]
MIDRNENKPGYKKTKVGWIPEEWDLKSLGSFGMFSKGKGISNSQKKETGIPCITYGEIYTEHDFIVKEFKSFIDKDTAKTSQTIKENDILFAGSGETLDEIGKCVAYTKSVEAYAGGDIVLFSPIGVNCFYLSYSLNSDLINRDKRKLGQGYSVVHIYSSSLKMLHIPLPSLPEQKKIAEILSTWDEAIERTKKLRDAKKRCKKALMQKLLTVRNRLPGCNKKWTVYKLSQLLELRNERSKKTNTLPLYSLTIENGITPKTDRYDREALVKDKDGKQYKKVYPNDIVFNPSNLRWGAIARSKLDFPVLVSPIYEVLSVLDASVSHPIFLSELLCSENQIRLFASRVEGTLVERMAVKLNVFLTTKVNIPSDLFEQSKIADVLSTADDEIKTLEQKLAALEKQKRGLMQKLLTGEIRVKT